MSLTRPIGAYVEVGVRCTVCGNLRLVVALATLEAGSFFGELGAQDAGPGYAMARNATVRALTPVELGVLDEAAFTAVFRSVPEFRDAIHATSHRQA